MIKWERAKAKGFRNSKSLISVLSGIITSSHIYSPEGPHPHDPYNAHFKCTLMVAWPCKRAKGVRKQKHLKSLEEALNIQHEGFLAFEASSTYVSEDHLSRQVAPLSAQSLLESSV